MKLKTKKKTIIFAVITVCLIFVMGKMGVTAMASGFSEGTSATPVGTSIRMTDDYTIDFSSLNTNSSTYTVDADTKLIALNVANQTYTVTGSTTMYGIVAGVDSTVVLNNASIAPATVSVNPINANGKALTVTLATGTANVINGTAAKRPGIYTTASTLTVNGSGKLTVNGGTTGAAIGGYAREAYGTIIIEGGEIIAKGGMNAAGIGGGEQNETGSITIAGGTIKANGNNYGSAGIGGGYQGPSGKITISGGTVNAVGGIYSAGIGGGYDAVAETVLISGGTITAQGGSQGAGIGGGLSKGFEKLTITGGNINATGGASSAGIGGGDVGTNGTITISGNPIINAQGGDQGPGIGAGRNAFSAPITISGGTIYAKGGNKAAGIGTSGTSNYGGNGVITGGNVLSVNGAGASASYEKKMYTDSTYQTLIYPNILTVDQLSSVAATSSLLTSDGIVYDLSEAQTIEYPSAGTEVISVWLPASSEDEIQLAEINGQHYISTYTRPASAYTGTLKEAYKLTFTPSVNGSATVVLPTRTINNYVASGDAVSMSATPDTFYQFKEWSTTDVVLNDNTLNDISFTMPSEDVTVLPIFEPIPVSGVSLNKTSTSIIVGSQETLIATIIPSEAFDQSVTWSSSDDSIATVDSVGNITAQEVGTATITVTTTDGGHTATCAVTVLPISVTGVSLDKTTVLIIEKEQETLVATVFPGDATDKSVVWASSNEQVAVVDQAGVITAISEGSSDITVTTTDGGYQAVAAITVVKEKYAVTFDMNGGSEENHTEDVKYGALIPEPATPVRRAYAFKGWYKEADGITKWDFTTETMSAQNITLYAQWERSDWEVYFNINTSGESHFVSEGLLVPIGTTVDISAYQPGGLDAPTNSGYAFLGWKDQGGEIVGNTIAPTGDVYLTANWISLTSIITWENENVVIYKNESTEAEVAKIVGAKAAYTDYLGISHSYPVTLDWNPVWISEGGVNEIQVYIVDPTDGEKVYGEEVSYLYVLNRPYISGNNEIWIFEGETINPDSLFVSGYGETPNFEEKRIDRGALALTFNDDAVDIWTAGTYWASFSGGFQDYDLKQTTFNFPVTVHVQKRAGLTQEESQQVDSSTFWVKVTEIYHTMKKGQIIDVTPLNYMDGGSLREETVGENLGYDRQLNVQVGEYVYMNPDIINILQEEKTGQLNIGLDGRSWVFTSDTIEAMGKNYPRGYYDLRMESQDNEAITALVGAETPQMQLKFSMNRTWFGTPTFVTTPNEAVKSAVANGATPYLFHYNENTNELELVGSMTVQTNGNLSIPMNGVYRDYVIVTSLPSTGNYRFTEHTNALDSKTYEAVATNQIESGHVLPSGSGLSGISTTKYTQLNAEGLVSEVSTSKPPIWLIVAFSGAGILLLGATGYFYKKRRNNDF